MRKGEDRFQVSFDTETLAVTGRVESKEGLDKVIATLAAHRELLPDVPHREGQ